MFYSFPRCYFLSSSNHLGKFKSSTVWMIKGQGKRTFVLWWHVTKPWEKQTQICKNNHISMEVGCVSTLENLGSRLEVGNYDRL